MGVGVDQGDEGKEVCLLVQKVSERSELVLVLERQARKSGTKRSRLSSLSDENTKRKKVEKSINNEKVCLPGFEKETADISMDSAVRDESIPKDALQEKPSKKKKKKLNNEHKAENKSVFEGTSIIEEVNSPEKTDGPNIPKTI